MNTLPANFILLCIFTTASVCIKECVIVEIQISDVVVLTLFVVKDTKRVKLVFVEGNYCTKIDSEIIYETMVRSNICNYM